MKTQIIKASLAFCFTCLFCISTSLAQSNDITTISMTWDQFQKLTKLSAILPNYNAETDGKVASFVIHFQRRNNLPVEFQIDGDDVNDSSPKVRNLAKKGDVFTFTNVMLKVPNSTTLQPRTGIVVKIR